MGGEVLFVEASLMPGTGKVQTTGRLGDVMKESVVIALSWLRSHAFRVRQLSLGGSVMFHLQQRVNSGAVVVAVVVTVSS